MPCLTISCAISILDSFVSVINTVSHHLLDVQCAQAVTFSLCQNTRPVEVNSRPIELYRPSTKVHNKSVHQVVASVRIARGGYIQQPAWSNKAKKLPHGGKFTDDVKWGVRNLQKPGKLIVLQLRSMTFHISIATLMFCPISLIRCSRLNLFKCRSSTSLFLWSANAHF